MIESPFNEEDASVWTPEEWLYFYEERAGFFEHDCGMSKAEAEAAAADSMVLEWARLASNHDDAERMQALADALEHCREGEYFYSTASKGPP